MSFMNQNSFAPSADAFAEVASDLGCEVGAIKAVFKVEAAGKFFESDGRPTMRFEPHHFPRQHWPKIGFHPREGKAKWREALRIGKTARREMFAKAEKIDAEAAFDASSHGGPQIMGFNAEACGYPDAATMVFAFRKPDEQLRGFAGFVKSDRRLLQAIRARDWETFARIYNGSGQVDEYAGRMKRAYAMESNWRKEGGAPTPVILRLGAQGEAVVQLQRALVSQGFLSENQVDGHFGTLTESAVEEYQAHRGLEVDGLVGARTWESLSTEGPASTASDVVEAPLPPTQGTVLKDRIAGALENGLPTATGFGAGGFLSSLSEDNMTLLIGGVIGLAAVGLIAYFVVPMIRPRIMGTRTS